MQDKKNRTIQTLYSRDVLLWERARRRSQRRNESFSQYVERLLREDERKLMGDDVSPTRDEVAELLS